MQDFMHPINQFPQMERLGQDLGPGKFRIAPTQAYRGEAGDEHDPEVRISGPGPGRELKPIQRRHHNIRHQHVELHGPGCRQGFHTIADGKHLMARPFQRPGQEGPHGCVVFGKQNAAHGCQAFAEGEWVESAIGPKMTR